MAVSSAATATPASTIDAVDPRRPDGGAHRVGERHRPHRTGEGGERAGAGARAAARHDDGGGPEPGTRRHAEQVRVGQRVAEDPLVGGAAPGQHGADQSAEHDPGRRICQTMSPSVAADAGRGSGAAGGGRRNARTRSASEMSAGPTETPSHHRAPTRAHRGRPSDRDGGPRLAGGRRAAGSWCLAASATSASAT